MAKQEQNRQRRRCSHSSQEWPNQQRSPSRQPRGPRLRNHMGRNQIRTTKQFIGIYYGPQENTPIEETEREYSQLATKFTPWRSREEWYGWWEWTAHFNANLEINTSHVKQIKSRNGKLLEKLIEDTKLTPINTQERTCKWTRQNRKNPTEKSVIDYILVSKEYVRSIEKITVDEMGIYRIKGKVDSDHNTITTTITSNLTTERTIEITQNQQQRGMEGVQQRNNQEV